MKIDEQWECWTLCAIKIEGTYRGGKSHDTCDHGLSRRSLRVKPPTSWAGKSKWFKKKEKKVFLCRNRFPDTMLYMTALAKAAAISKFDLSCRPLSAQRAFMANTRDTRTNLMSRFAWSNVNCVRSTFDYYRYVIPGTFISYAINSIVWYQLPRVNQPFI